MTSMTPPAPRSPRISDESPGDRSEHSCARRDSHSRGGRPSSPGHLGLVRGLTRNPPRVERWRDLQQLRDDRSAGRAQVWARLCFAGTEQKCNPSRRVSGEAPMPVLRPVVSSPLPSEPDLRVPPHPALHEHWSGRPLLQLPLSVKYPLPFQAAARRYSPATSFHPIVLLAHWTPSPCRRLSRPPWWRVTATTTTGPPPRPDGHSGRCACPEPRRVRRAPPGRFPRSLTDRLAGSAPSCTPGASPRATATRPAASTARTENGRPRRSRTATGIEHPNSP